ncbi:MAG: hypothetical protein IPM38_10065 [Ignavibacteria bacterium]|nr:hypothetical protein [Ignavibacteria bacterium]
MESYCVDKNRGNKNSKFESEEFALYVKSLETGSYKWSEDDSFQIGLFRNMLFSALDCKEFEWMEHFVNNYSKELNPEHRDNMKYYSFALLEYGRKNYELALENLSKVEYKFFSFQNGRKRSDV